MQETWVQYLGQEDTLDKEMATYSSNLPREFHGQRDSGGLQSLELQRFGHDWATNTFTSSLYQWFGNLLSLFFYLIETPYVEHFI